MYTGDMETYVISEDNYASLLRMVRRKHRMTQHLIAVIMNERRGKPATNDKGRVMDSQVSMWETEDIEPRITSYVRWADANGCDLVLVPRRHEDEIDGELDWVEEEDVEILTAT